MSIARGGGKGTRGKLSARIPIQPRMQKQLTRTRATLHFLFSAHTIALLLPLPSPAPSPGGVHRPPRIPPTGPHGPSPGEVCPRRISLPGGHKFMRRCRIVDIKVPDRSLTPSSCRHPSHARPHSPNQCCVLVPTTPSPHHGRLGWGRGGLGEPRGTANEQRKTTSTLSHTFFHVIL